MVDFLQVALSARPARVAVAIPDGTIHAGPPNWHELCLGALAHLGRVWGGAGMVLLPVGSGGIAPPLMRALAQYDPDFVVPYGYPNDNLPDQWIPQPARDQLARHISAPDPYELNDAPTLASPVGEPNYPLTDIEVFAQDLPLPAALVVRGDSDVELLVAARVGTFTNWDRTRHSQAGRAIEEIEVDTPQYGLVALSYGAPDSVPGNFLAPGLLKRLPFQRSMHGLGYLFRGIKQPDAVTVVVGDELADFALTLLLERMYGPGSAMWLPRRFLRDADIPGAEACLIAAQALRRGLERRSSIMITSTSAEMAVLREARGALSESLGTAPHAMTTTNTAGLLLPADAFELAGPNDVPLPAPSLLVDPHRIDLPKTVPFAGGVAAEEVIPPIPRVAEPLPASSVRWHTDAMVASAAFPPRRASNGLVSELVVPDADVRAGRDGATWMSATPFIGTSDVARVHHLTRVTLTEPSAYGAIESLLASEGWFARPSNVAGFYLGAIEMWGGWDRLAQDLKDPYARGVLDAFTSARTGYGTLPGATARPVLHLSDIAKATNLALDRSEAGALAERWAQRGILTRGFALKCSRCRYADFYPAESVGQSFTCIRCSEANSPTGESWPIKNLGPTWYFRMDELVYQALDQGLTGPLLALSWVKRQYPKAGMRFALGVEVMNASGSIVTDLDFVVLLGSRLVVGEAKTNGSLGNSQTSRKGQVRKLRTIAERIAADQLVLATTTENWEPTSIRDAKDVFRDAWRPRLVITSVN